MLNYSKTGAGQTNSVHALFCKRKKYGHKHSYKCGALTLNIFYFKKQIYSAVAAVAVAAVAEYMGFKYREKLDGL